MGCCAQSHDTGVPHAFKDCHAWVPLCMLFASKSHAYMTDTHGCQNACNAITFMVHAEYANLAHARMHAHTSRAHSHLRCQSDG